MAIVGRNREIRTLVRSLSGRESELIAVYGRRRIGKTFLIREVYKENIVFEVIGLYKGCMKDQLKNFHEQLIVRDKKFGKMRPPSDWFGAFAMLKNYLDSLKNNKSNEQAGKKKVVFIDEFPWMATTRSKFLMWFDNFWNSYCTRRNDLIVVICGSAASYMVNNIIKNKGGLHNRLSHRIRLEPFNLYETQLFMKSKNMNLEYYDLLQLYMVLGGVPHYLNKIIKGQSLMQNIDRLCFENGGELVNEFNEVFTSLFTDSGLHMEMVKVLAGSKKGMTRAALMEECSLSRNGFTSNILHELVESGFVTQYLPYGRRNRNSLFRLSDEYCLFYLKFIESHKNQGAGTWDKIFSKQAYKIWSGFAFETICLKHVQQIKNAIGVGRVYSINSSWFNENAQVDLVIDRDDNRINLFEMKFYKGPFFVDKAYSEILRKKVIEFSQTTKTRKGVFISLLTTFGIKQNDHSINTIENNLTMDCLFTEGNN